MIVNDGGRTTNMGRYAWVGVNQENILEEEGNNVIKERKGKQREGKRCSNSRVDGFEGLDTTTDASIRFTRQS